MKHLLLLMSLGATLTQSAWAQSFCASDGQLTPVTLVERFISADCEACWRAAPAPERSARTLTIDWIVPSGQGDEAPLSAGASQDAMTRLKTLGRTAPATSFVTRTKVRGTHAQKLRVAHGVPLGGYIGASIELRATKIPRRPAHLKAWLVLVETIAAGTEGTPAERNLVRNVLLSSWNRPDEPTTTAQTIFREIRPLSIPLGATPARLRVLAWVQDAHGRVLAAAQSVCAPGE